MSKADPNCANFIPWTANLICIKTKIRGSNNNGFPQNLPMGSFCNRAVEFAGDVEQARLLSRFEALNLRSKNYIKIDHMQITG